MSDNFDDMLDKAAEGMAIGQVTVLGQAVAAFYNQLLLGLIDKDSALFMTSQFMEIVLQGNKYGADNE